MLKRMRRDEHEVTGARLCIRRDGVLHKFARLYWSNQDTSLYISTYTPAGSDVYFGSTTVPPPGVGSESIDFTSGLVASDANPKLSLHESGQAHMQVGQLRSKGILGRRLGEGSGGHVATVQTFDVSSLPVLGRSPSTGRVPDLIAVADEEDWWTAPRWLVLAFAEDLDRARGYPLHITMRRRLRPTLHVALKPAASSAPESMKHSGALIVGGWPLGYPPDAPLRMLYAVTKSRGPI